MDFTCAVELSALYLGSDEVIEFRSQIHILRWHRINIRILGKDCQ